MTSALVDAPALLAELRSGARPLLLDVRWALAGPDRPAYVAGHLPGAVFCDLDADLAAPPGDEGRHPLPSQDAMTYALRRLGVAPGRDVVAYDGGAGAAAARAWWCLRWAGHEQVRVLDGGLEAWTRAGGPLETGEVLPEPAPDAVAQVGAMPVRTAEEVLAGRAGTLVDARAVERFAGEVEPMDPVAGHIPGAVSCPTTQVQGLDGRYLPPEVLRGMLAPLAKDGEGLTAYCGSGVTASQLVLAGYEAGLETALYAGSWSHWVRDPERPVATGR